MRTIESDVPVTISGYKHRTPYNRYTVVALLPELKVLEVGQSFLVPVEDISRCGQYSKAINAAITCVRFDQLPRGWDYKVQSRRDEGGVRIWRIR